VRYDDADGAPIEEVARLAPDLILATNSGITEAEYKKLSKIAPVVAYPEAPWITPWQDSLETAGKALGRTSLAEEVAEEAQEQINQAKADYPEIQGKSLIFGYLNTADLSSVGFYMPADPRVKFMLDLGFVSAPALEGLVKPGLYYGTVSAERASELESDVLLTYGESDKDLATFTKDKLLGQLPALKAGHAYAVTDKHIGLATTNPSPLSIPYVIAHYLPDMVKAVSGS
jgi:iron complex transport system substrate-binding protein